MKIVRADLHQVRLPLVHEFQTSSHRKGFLEHLLVELTDEDGRTGWGEIACPSDPFFAPDTVATSWHVATTYLLPAVVGRSVSSAPEVSGAYAKVRGHQFAKAGVDVAAWSLWSARQGFRCPRRSGARGPRSSQGFRSASRRPSTTCSSRCTTTTSGPGTRGSS